MRRLTSVRWFVLFTSCLMLTAMMVLSMQAAWWGWRHGGEDWQACVVPVAFNSLGEGPLELFVVFPAVALWGLVGTWMVCKR